MNKERLPKAQAQIKQVVNAYHKCRLAACEGIELNQAKLKFAFKFISVAFMLVNTPITRDCFDQAIDLANPVEQLGALVSYSTVDTFKDSDWSDVLLTSAALTVLAKAEIKVAEFVHMFRTAIRSMN